MRSSICVWTVLLLIAATSPAKAQVSIFTGSQNQVFVDVFDQDLPADSNQTTPWNALPFSGTAEGKLSTADEKLTADLSTTSFSFGYSASTDSTDFIQDDGESTAYFTADPNTSFSLKGTFTANNSLADFTVSLIDVTQSFTTIESFDSSTNTPPFIASGALTAGDEYELDDVLSLFNGNTGGSLTSSASLDMTFAATTPPSSTPLPSAGPGALLLVSLLAGARFFRIARAGK